MVFTSVGVAFNGVALVESTLPAAVLQKSLQEALRTLELSTTGNLLALKQAACAIRRERFAARLLQ